MTIELRHPLIALAVLIAALAAIVGVSVVTTLYHVERNLGAWVICSNCNSVFHPAKRQIVMECRPTERLVEVRTYHLGN